MYPFFNLFFLILAKSWFVMSITLIGLGLGDEKDITIRGLEAIKACDALFLESYTSVIGVPKERLVRFT